MMSFILFTTLSLITLFYINPIHSQSGFRRCSRPLPPDNGAIMFRSFFRGEGTQATYTCNPGYTLFGSSVRTCQRRSFRAGNRLSWTDVAPHCWISACDILPTSTFVSVWVGYNTSIRINQVSVGTVATFYCQDTDMLLQGSSTRTCLSRNRWSGSQPQCVNRNTVDAVTVIWSTTTASIGVMVCCIVICSVVYRSRKSLTQSIRRHTRTSISSMESHTQNTFNLDTHNHNQTNSTTAPIQSGSNGSSGSDSVEVIENLSKSELQQVPPPPYQKVIATSIYDAPIYEEQTT